MSNMHGYSGSNHDRWVERGRNSSALGKMQKQFWFTKSAVIRKLGKKEDEHIVASDAELDAKIELFKAIESSTRDLQALLAEYQSKLCALAQEENTLGRMLKENGRAERNHAGRMMIATGKSLSYTAQQRVALRNPLLRLFQEVDTFQSRAVEDTMMTVNEMERARTEYRGALMWMKDVSGKGDFNPDQGHQLEKFREVQVTVKAKKARFDALKVKSLQKVDLLAASRCNMFSHALIVYQNNLILFSEKTAKTLNMVTVNFQGHQPYDFQVIKELAEMKIEEDAKDEDEKLLTMDGDDRMFFNAEFHDDPNAVKQKVKGKKTEGKECQEKDDRVTKSESMVNLFDNEDSDRGDPFDLLTGENEVSGPNLWPMPQVDESGDSYTQQVLREIFDNPDQLGLQSLPPYGGDWPAVQPTNSSTESGAKSAEADQFQFTWPISSQAVNTSGILLPSQLLDFGSMEWPHSTTATKNSPQTQAALKTAAVSKVPAAGGGNLQQEVNKMDWYRVFQDIDPLGDPNSALLGLSSGDGKKC